MNLHSPMQAYETVSYREWSYSLTLDDFPNGCALRTDAVSGRQWAFGRNKLGMLVSAPLGVRLCNGCDRPITQHLCTDCNLVFLEDA